MNAGAFFFIIYKLFFKKLFTNSNLYSNVINRCFWHQTLGDDNLDNIRLWLWLQGALSITRAKQHKLIGHFGDIESVYRANLSDYNELGFLTDEDLNYLSKKDLTYAEDMQRELNKYSAHVITMDSDIYPDLLRTIHQPPTVLYARGSFLDFNNVFMLSMVGTRKATNYGKVSAYNIARELSKSGVTVVSGLAMGIDAKSHEGALSGGSPTVAVIGCGVDIAYPRINAPLMNKIMKNGCVISEYPLGAPPEKYHFPERNRIIAGMSKGTIVVEADLKSGSLITARYATEENRDVFALPGNINNPTSKGSNALLQDGAHLIASTKDLVSYYNLEYIDKIPVTYEDSSKTGIEDKILNAIGDEIVHLDTICQRTCLDTGTVNANLLMMEIKGKVIKLAGGYYSRT